jgi:hypothetical protein
MCISIQAPGSMLAAQTGSIFNMLLAGMQVLAFIGTGRNNLIQNIHQILLN